jgi:hypothetical protein
VAFDERPAASFFALLNRGLKRGKPAARAWFLEWFGAEFDFDDFDDDNEVSVLDDEPGDYAHGFYDNH